MVYPTNMNIGGTAAKVLQTTSSNTREKAQVSSPFSIEDVPPFGQKYSTLEDNKFKWIEAAGIKEATKRPNLDFERFAENYINDEPQILFVSEYVVEDRILGSLIVWEKYYSSTHYEVFKRNTFQSNSKFERILFLDSQSLEEERAHFIGYIKDILGFDSIDEDNIYIMFDEQLREDRIYEYKVSASRVPKHPKEIDYDMVLESKGLLNTSEIISTNTSTLFDLAGTILGSRDLAWAIAISNDRTRFFGRAPSEQSVSVILSDRVDRGSINVFIPRDVEDILNIFKESLSLFDTKPAIERLIDSLGGLPGEFRKAFLSAIDEERNSFSYDHFKEKVRENTPVFDLVLDIAESAPGEDPTLLERLTDNDATKKLSSLSITLPNAKGSEVLTSVVGLSNIFKFVNDTMILVLYSQEKETFVKLQEIKAEIEGQRTLLGDDTLDAATEEIRGEIENSADSEVTSEVANFFGVPVGEKDDDKEAEEGESSGGNRTLPGFSVV